MTDGAEQLRAVIEPVVAPLGLHLYDLELAGARGRAPTLRVLVQRDGGEGADLEAITSATQALSPVLDADPRAGELLCGAYTLEVSSPGLERPLRRREHWVGLADEVVSVKARVGDTTERWRGVVTAVDDDGVELEVDGARRRVDFADVTSAHTVFDWGPAEKAKR